MADEAVLAVQNWLNKTYTGIPGFEPAPTDGHTGWATIYALREALQHELGISSIGEGFGTATRTALSGVVDQLKPGYKGNIAQLIQGAFWCKGINPGTELNQNFSAETEQAFKSLQQDAGLTADGIVTVNLMAALFDMSAFVLVSGGDANVRQLQQWLNAEYSTYLGIMPCDGIYQRDTNVGLIYALQRAVGISADIANGNFGDATNAALKNVQLSVGSTGLLVKIVKYGLYLNSMYSGDFSESFGSDVATSIIRFRKFMKYPNETSGIADYTVIKGLVTSNGDTGRDSIALDTATQLTAEDVKHFRDYGFSIVGRYLTGTVGTDFKPKNLTPTEIKTILDGGMKFFPIYEDGGYVETYFTASQGRKDAQIAVAAALELGLPSGTVVYFAVDVDFQEGDIEGTVIPYITAVQNALEGSIYKTGIYGTRNVCLHAEEHGIQYSFVANMSYGWSGNLGFKMPSNWAFDQFVEYPIYGVSIDQDASSGKDQGVSHVSSSVKEVNTEFFNYLKKVQDDADAFVKNMDKNGNTVPDSLMAARLICQLYRQFRYASLPWTIMTGALNDTWIYNENKKWNITSDDDFPELTDTATGIKTDFIHMIAALASLLNFNAAVSATGTQDLAGWAGDLLTGISDSIKSADKYANLLVAMEDHIGKDASKGKSSFGVGDLLADADAVNIYASLKNGNASLYSIIDRYYNNKGNTERFNQYVSNRFSGNHDKIESDALRVLNPDGELAQTAEFGNALNAFKDKFEVSYSPDQATMAASVFKNMIQGHLEH